MKLKIKVKVVSPNCTPKISEKGEWIDLRADKEYLFDSPKSTTLKQHNGKKYRKVIFSKALINLGVIMELPKGFEAVVVPRSSTFKNFKVIQTNNLGIIDNVYKGPNDIWKMPVLALEEGKINAGDRVCQFRIQPSQKANIWQKLKWLISSGIEIEYVDNIESSDRGGFGSTGVK